MPVDEPSEAKTEPADGLPKDGFPDNAMLTVGTPQEDRADAVPWMARTRSMPVLVGDLPEAWVGPPEAPADEPAQ